MAWLAFPLRRRRPFQLSLGPWGLLVLVGILVLYPVILIVVGSFQDTRPGQPAIFSLDPWRLALSDPTMLSAIRNTVLLTFVREAIAFPVGIALAWTIARTDIPGAEWLEFLFWIAFFLPTLPVTLGWILLFQPTNGLANQLLTMLPFVQSGPFNIYTFWGIVWAHLAGKTIAVKVMLLTPAFRSLDASLEEASRVSGASTIGTLFRVVVPVMTPILLVVLLLSIIYALQAFDIELILGMPFRFYVFSTLIYTLLQQDPPAYPAAMALGSSILLLMLPFIVMQRLATGRRSYVTVTGHFKAYKLQLGKWRPWVFTAVSVIGLVTTAIPLIFLVIATFMKLFGFFNLSDPWTIDQWRRVLGDQLFLSSVMNTFLLAAGTAIGGAVLYTLVAYVVVRTRFLARSFLDLVSWFPSTLPGIILGLGLLSLFLGTPLLRAFYGTIVLMIVATVIASTPVGVQLIKSNFVQLGAELEEAAKVSGGSWWQVFRRVLLPIITPTVLLAGAVCFIAAARDVSTVALLASVSTRPLSLLQLDFMVEGRYEAAAVVGVIVVVMTTGVALIARLLGLKVGLAR